MHILLAHKALSHFQNINWSTWPPISCGLRNLSSDPLFSFWYIRRSDALHKCSRDAVTRPKTDVISSRPRRDQDVPFFQTHKTKMRPRHSTFKTETFHFSNFQAGNVQPSRPRCSKKRLETETFKNKTTFLPSKASMLLFNVQRHHSIRTPAVLDHPQCTGFS